MVFLVAEIGVNWDGDIELAKEIMINAKKSGCNAVKFQAFDENILGRHPEALRLMKSSITEDNVEIINNTAKDVGIEWFCTPMYAKAVEFLNPFVSRFKIREFDGRILLENKKTPLIEAVVNTHKEIIVSTQKSPKYCIYYNKPNFKWLYCVPKYPCELNEINFKEISNFHGYSNHCPEIIAPLTAAILGAEILEIHVTADKTKNYVDNNVSFNFFELEQFCKLVKKSRVIKH